MEYLEVLQGLFFLSSIDKNWSLGIKDKIESVFQRAYLKERFERDLPYQKKNIQSILSKVFGYLLKSKDSLSVSDTPVDQDWISSFFNKIQDVSREDAQEIWAKILAQEITEPESISLQTLHILSTLGKKDAEKFRSLCSYVIGYEMVLNPTKFIFKDGSSDTFDFLSLQEIGLIHSIQGSGDLSITIGNDVNDSCFLIQIGNKKFNLLEDNSVLKNVELSFPATVPLTRAGSELCKIVLDSTDVLSKHEIVLKQINEILKENYTLQEVQTN